MLTQRITHLSILLAVWFTVMASSEANQAPIEPSLKSKLDAGEKANIMVQFAPTKPVLDSVKVPEGASRGERSSAVNKALEEHRDRTQAGVRSKLDAKGIKYESFWINNQLSVKDADTSVVNLIASDPEVVAIQEERVAHIMG